ncbi:MAG: alpha-glucuronidase family glycosyl hydrolase [Breznakibacter sp.]
MMRLSFLPFFCATLITFHANAQTDDDLWLRYKPLPKETTNAYVAQIKNVVTSEKSATLNAAVQELQRALGTIRSSPVETGNHVIAHSVIMGTGKNAVVKAVIGTKKLNMLGHDGFMVKQTVWNGLPVTIVAGNSDAGILYGTFALLRHLQLGLPLDGLDITETPKFQKRLLNHWDNLDGTVERGYAGHSIFWNYDVPVTKRQQRLVDYARANASVGINGTVINNVNATPQILSETYLKQTAEIADLLRPYKIQVYLSINFSSPKALGRLENSDPLNPLVAAWWKGKVKEIYQLIPDFGGFLVKANSEGLPGPQDYGRTHADGANMLADVLKPYGGVVMWRAFVYNPTPEDRAKQAYAEFKPLDGQFRPNVIVQVKNGPIDFQPREPFSPLFGAMAKTPLMMEFQITQEYLGHSNHLVFLAPMYKEVLESDTYCQGQGSTVAQTLDGTIFRHAVTAIAGVANIGRDANWCGHYFAQANWYAYGRLSWNHGLSSAQIADEWLKMTFSDEAAFVDPVKEMMLASHQACVDYMAPLGLHHIMGWDHHYGPEPWTHIENARADWLPGYYHRAMADGIGFDRTGKGSNATAQYSHPLCTQFNDPATCPEGFLLWFHHLQWDYPMKSGRTLWNELVFRYYKGADQVKGFQRTWDSMETYVDAQRLRAVQYRLKIQARDAIWWRDACLLYFQTFSNQPIPLQYERPLHDLDDLMKIKLDMKHHN